MNWTRVSQIKGHDADLWFGKDSEGYSRYTVTSRHAQTGMTVEPTACDGANTPMAAIDTYLADRDKAGGK